ncbi:MAG: hypothetical protein U1E17_15905 [Geminicoccaceae bacterium]
MLISQAAGNLTRRASLAGLPVRVDDAAGHARTLAAKLGELVSVRISVPRATASPTTAPPSRLPSTAISGCSPRRHPIA